MLKRVLALFLAGLMAANAVLASAAEANFWKERRLAMAPRTSYVVPRTPVTGTKYDVRRTLSQFGTIRPQSKIVNRKSKIDIEIFHIQDVHQNAEAQKNIGAVIQELIDQDRADLIALEGAFGSIDLSAFRSFPHQPSVRNVADYLLRENKIGGPIHAAFVSPKKIPPIVGVDDRAHYDANVSAYLQSTKHQAQSTNEIQNLKSEIRNQKELIFNNRLLRFDGIVDEYREGEMELGEYVEHLARFDVDLSRPVSTFLEALGLEDSIDYDRVERERTSLLARLMGKLDQNESRQLMAAGMSFRKGELNHADFYSYLEDLSREKNLPFSSRLRDYIRYVLLADSIDGNQLLKDLRALESDIYGQLIQTPEEKELVSESRRLYLTGKLVEFSLTAEEWEEYKSVRSALSVVRSTRNKINAFSLNDAPRTAHHGLQSFEDFYREAETRDQLMADNLKKAMKKHNAQSVVLVTGGFHSQGISHKLQDIRMINFVPRITKLEGPRARGSEGTYLSIFTQQKTPLEELFAGKKLFLAQEALPPETLKTAAVGTAIETFRTAPHLLPRIKTLISTVIGWSSVRIEKVSESIYHLIGERTIAQHYDDHFSIKDIALIETTKTISLLSLLVGYVDLFSTSFSFGLWPWAVAILSMVLLFDKRFWRHGWIPLPARQLAADGISLANRLPIFSPKFPLMPLILMMAKRKGQERIRAKEIPGIPSIKDLEAALPYVHAHLIYANKGNIAYEWLMRGLMGNPYLLKALIEKGGLTPREERYWQKKIPRVSNNGVIASVKGLKEKAVKLGFSENAILKALGIPAGVRSVIIVHNNKRNFHRTLLEETLHAFEDFPKTNVMAINLAHEIVNDFEQLLFYGSPPQAGRAILNYTRWGSFFKRMLYQRYVVEMGFNPNTDMRSILQALKRDFQEEALVDGAWSIPEIFFNNDLTLMGRPPFMSRSRFLDVYRDDLVAYLNQLIKQEKFSQFYWLFENWELEQSDTAESFTTALLYEIFFQWWIERLVEPAKARATFAAVWEPFRMSLPWIGVLVLGDYSNFIHWVYAVLVHIAVNGAVFWLEHRLFGRNPPVFLLLKIFFLPFITIRSHWRHDYSFFGFVELKFEENVRIEEYSESYDSFVLYYDGRPVNPSVLKSMDMNDMMNLIDRASNLIESEPRITAFEEGRLDPDKSENVMVFGWQCLQVWDRLRDLAASAETEELDLLIEYVFDSHNPRRPFSEIISRSLFGTALNLNRRTFYESMSKSKVSIERANQILNSLPYVNMVMLERVPSVHDLQQNFHQKENEAERHIVLTDQGRSFFVRGISPTRGIIAYRNFNDQVADIHTHFADRPFSRGDIDVIKGQVEAGESYALKGNVGFFVRSPGGIFIYRVNEYSPIYDRMDRENDIYFMANEVRIVTLDGKSRSQRFGEYTNHNQGETGRYLISALEGGVQELSILFDDGDRIDFYPWAYFDWKGVMNDSFFPLLDQLNPHGEMKRSVTQNDSAEAFSTAFLYDLLFQWWIERFVEPAKARATFAALWEPTRMVLPWIILPVFFDWSLLHTAILHIILNGAVFWLEHRLFGRNPPLSLLLKIFFLPFITIKSHWTHDYNVNRLANQDPILILMVDEPISSPIAQRIRDLIQTKGLEGKVELIESVQDFSGGERVAEDRLDELLNQYDPTILLFFRGKRALKNPYMIQRVVEKGVRVAVRVGAGYDNISKDFTGDHKLPFLRTPFKRSVSHMALRFLVGALRLEQRTPINEANSDVTGIEALKPIFDFPLEEFHEALKESHEYFNRGQMTPAQKELVFGSVSQEEFLQLAQSLNGKSIGLHGFGEIAQDVARRLALLKEISSKVYRMELTYTLMATSPTLMNSRSKKAALAKDWGVQIISEKELYEQADYISIHIPSADSNRHRINAALLHGRTKKLVLINTARRDLVDESMFSLIGTEGYPEDLVYMGDIDFDSASDQLRTNYPEKMIFSPHIGGLTQSAKTDRDNKLMQSLESLIAVLQGRSTVEDEGLVILNNVPIAPLGPSLSQAAEAISTAFLYETVVQPLIPKSWDEAKARATFAALWEPTRMVLPWIGVLVLGDYSNFIHWVYAALVHIAVNGAVFWLEHRLFGRNPPLSLLLKIFFLPFITIRSHWVHDNESFQKQNPPSVLSMVARFIPIPKASAPVLLGAFGFITIEMVTKFTGRLALDYQNVNPVAYMIYVPKIILVSALVFHAIREVITYRKSGRIKSLDYIRAFWMMPLSDKAIMVMSSMVTGFFGMLFFVGTMKSSMEFHMIFLIATIAHTFSIFMGYFIFGLLMEEAVEKPTTQQKKALRIIGVGLLFVFMKTIQDYSHGHVIAYLWDNGILPLMLGMILGVADSLISKWFLSYRYPHDDLIHNSIRPIWTNLSFVTVWISTFGYAFILKMFDAPQAVEIFSAGLVPYFFSLPALTIVLLLATSLSYYPNQIARFYLRRRMINADFNILAMTKPVFAWAMAYLVYATAVQWWQYIVGAFIVVGGLKMLGGSYQELPLKESSLEAQRTILGAMVTDLHQKDSSKVIVLKEPLQEGKSIFYKIVPRKTLINRTDPNNSLLDLYRTQNLSPGPDGSDWLKYKTKDIAAKTVPIPQLDDGHNLEFRATFIKERKARARYNAKNDNCNICLSLVIEKFVNESWLDSGKINYVVNPIPYLPPIEGAGDENQPKLMAAIWREHRPQRDIRDLDVIRKYRRDLAAINSSPSLKSGKNWRFGFNGSHYQKLEDGQEIYDVPHGGATQNHVHGHLVQVDLPNDNVNIEWANDDPVYPGVRRGIARIIPGPDTSSDYAVAVLEATGEDNMIKMDEILHEMLMAITEKGDSFNFMITDVTEPGDKERTIRFFVTGRIRFNPEQADTAGMGWLETLGGIANIESTIDVYNQLMEAEDPVSVFREWLLSVAYSRDQVEQLIRPQTAPAESISAGLFYELLIQPFIPAHWDHAKARAVSVVIIEHVRMLLPWIVLFIGFDWTNPLHLLVTALIHLEVNVILFWIEHTLDPERGPPPVGLFWSIVLFPIFTARRHFHHDVLFNQKNNPSLLPRLQWPIVFSSIATPEGTKVSSLLTQPLLTENAAGKSIDQIKSNDLVLKIAIRKLLKASEQDDYRDYFSIYQPIQKDKLSDDAREYIVSAAYRNYSRKINFSVNPTSDDITPYRVLLILALYVLDRGPRNFSDSSYAELDACLKTLQNRGRVSGFLSLPVLFSLATSFRVSPDELFELISSRNRDLPGEVGEKKNRLSAALVGLHLQYDFIPGDMIDLRLTKDYLAGMVNKSEQTVEDDWALVHALQFVGSPYDKNNPFFTIRRNFFDGAELDSSEWKSRQTFLRTIAEFREGRWQVKESILGAFRRTRDRILEEQSRSGIFNLFPRWEFFFYQIYEMFEGTHLDENTSRFIRPLEEVLLDPISNKGVMGLPGQSGSFNSSQHYLHRLDGKIKILEAGFPVGDQPAEAFSSALFYEILIQPFITAHWDPAKARATSAVIVEHARMLLPWIGVLVLGNYTNPMHWIMAAIVHILVNGALFWKEHEVLDRPNPPVLLFLSIVFLPVLSAWFHWKHDYASFKDNIENILPRLQSPIVVTSITTPEGFSVPAVLFQPLLMENKNPASGESNKTNDKSADPSSDQGIAPISVTSSINIDGAKDERSVPLGIGISWEETVEIAQELFRNNIPTYGSYFDEEETEEMKIKVNMVSDAMKSPLENENLFKRYIEKLRRYHKGGKTYDVVIHLHYDQYSQYHSLPHAHNLIIVPSRTGSVDEGAKMEGVDEFINGLKDWARQEVKDGYLEDNQKRLVAQFMDTLVRSKGIVDLSFGRLGDIEKIFTHFMVGDMSFGRLMEGLSLVGFNPSTSHHLIKIFLMTGKSDEVSDPRPVSLEHRLDHFLMREEQLSPTGKKVLEELIRAREEGQLEVNRDLFPSVENPHLEYFTKIDFSNIPIQEIMEGLVNLCVTSGCSRACLHCAAAPSRLVHSMPYNRLLSILNQTHISGARRLNDRNFGFHMETEFMDYYDPLYDADAGDVLKAFFSFYPDQEVEIVTRGWYLGDKIGPRAARKISGLFSKHQNFKMVLSVDLYDIRRDIARYIVRMTHVLEAFSPKYSWIGTVRDEGNTKETLEAAYWIRSLSSHVFTPLLEEDPAQTPMVSAVGRGKNLSTSSRYDVFDCNFGCHLKPTGQIFRKIRLDKERSGKDAVVHRYEPLVSLWSEREAIPLSRLLPVFIRGVRGFVLHFQNNKSPAEAFSTALLYETLIQWWLPKSVDQAKARATFAALWEPTRMVLPWIILPVFFDWSLLHTAILHIILNGAVFWLEHRLFGRNPPVSLLLKIVFLPFITIRSHWMHDVEQMETHGIRTIIDVASRAFFETIKAAIVLSLGIGLIDLTWGSVHAWPWIVALLCLTLLFNKRYWNPGMQLAANGANLISGNALFAPRFPLTPLILLMDNNSDSSGDGEGEPQKNDDLDALKWAYMDSEHYQTPNELLFQEIPTTAEETENWLIEMLDEINKTHIHFENPGDIAEFFIRTLELELEIRARFPDQRNLIKMLLTLRAVSVEYAFFISEEIDQPVVDYLSSALINRARLSPELGEIASSYIDNEREIMALKNLGYAFLYGRSENSSGSNDPDLLTNNESDFDGLADVIAEQATTDNELWLNPFEAVSRHIEEVGSTDVYIEDRLFATGNSSKTLLLFVKDLCAIGFNEWIFDRSDYLFDLLYELKNYGHYPREKTVETLEDFLSSDFNFTVYPEEEDLYALLIGEKYLNISGWDKREGLESELRYLVKLQRLRQATKSTIQFLPASRYLLDDDRYYAIRDQIAETSGRTNGKRILVGVLDINALDDSKTTTVGTYSTRGHPPQKRPYLQWEGLSYSAYVVAQGKYKRGWGTPNQVVGLKVKGQTKLLDALSDDIFLTRSLLSNQIDQFDFVFVHNNEIEGRSDFNDDEDNESPQTDPSFGGTLDEVDVTEKIIIEGTPAEAFSTALLYETLIQWWLPKSVDQAKARATFAALWEPFRMTLPWMGVLVLGDYSNPIHWINAALIHIIVNGVLFWKEHEILNRRPPVLLFLSIFLFPFLSAWFHWEHDYNRFQTQNLPSALSVAGQDGFKPVDLNNRTKATLPLGVKLAEKIAGHKGGLWYLRNAWWIETSLFGILPLLSLLVFPNQGNVVLSFLWAFSFWPGHKLREKWLEENYSTFVGQKEVRLTFAAHMAAIDGSLLLSWAAPVVLSIPLIVMIWAAVLIYHRNLNYPSGWVEWLNDAPSMMKRKVALILKDDAPIRWMLRQMLDPTTTFYIAFAHRLDTGYVDIRFNPALISNSRLLTNLGVQSLAHVGPLILLHRSAADAGNKLKPTLGHEFGHAYLTEVDVHDWSSIHEIFAVIRRDRDTEGNMNKFYQGLLDRDVVSTMLTFNYEDHAKGYLELVHSTFQDGEAVSLEVARNFACGVPMSLSVGLFDLAFNLAIILMPAYKPFYEAGHPEAAALKEKILAESGSVLYPHQVGRIFEIVESLDLPRVGGWLDPDVFRQLYQNFELSFRASGFNFWDRSFDGSDFSTDSLLEDTSVGELFRGVDELEEYVPTGQMVDQLDVQPNESVLIVGNGSDPGIPMGFALRSNRVDINQPSWDLSHQQRQLNENIQWRADAFEEKWGVPFPRDHIDNETYEGLIQDVNLPAKTYSTLVLPNVIEVASIPLDEFVHLSFSAMKDEFTLLVSVLSFFDNHLPEFVSIAEQQGYTLERQEDLTYSDISIPRPMSVFRVTRNKNRSDEAIFGEVGPLGVGRKFAPPGRETDSNRPSRPDSDDPLPMIHDRFKSALARMRSA